MRPAFRWKSAGQVQNLDDLRQVARDLQLAAEAEPHWRCSMALMNASRAVDAACGEVFDAYLALPRAT